MTGGLRGEADKTQRHADAGSTEAPLAMRRSRAALPISIVISRDMLLHGSFGLLQEYEKPKHI